MTISGAPKPAPTDLSREPLVLEDLLDNGQGVGRIGGLVAFVTGGLPGERVKIAVDEVKRNYVSAHAVEIEGRSPDRIDSICPVFPRCGGCQVLHLRYDAQLEWKRRMVAQALARLGGISSANVSAAIASPNPTPGYRNKVSLVSRRIKGAVRLGFYAARSHHVVPIDHCPVAIGRLDEAIRALVKATSEAPHAFDDVRHVVARASATGPELVVSMNSEVAKRARAEDTDAFRRSIGGLTGLVANWDPPSENAIFGRRFATLWGSPQLSESVAGANLSFGIASFFQINTPILEAIADRIAALLSGCKRVVDLYCGVGTFGVILGKRGIPSTGVELSGPAVEEAAQNAAANGVTCAAFEQAGAADAVTGNRGRTLFEGADAAIVDPPRRGCEAEVIAALVHHRPPMLLYVSCNPATLARDAKALVAGGYKIARVTPYDMFPQTGHVEVLAEFER